MADTEISNVHSASPAPAIAILFPEQLSQGTVEMVFQRQIQEFPIRRALGVRDPFQELVLVHCPQGPATSGQTVSMSAVRTGHIVIPLQGRTDPDSDGLLTNVKM